MPCLLILVLHRYTIEFWTLHHHYRHIIVSIRDSIVLKSCNIKHDFPSTFPGGSLVYLKNVLLPAIYSNSHRFIQHTVVYGRIIVSMDCVLSSWHYITRSCRGLYPMRMSQWLLQNGQPSATWTFLTRYLYSISRSFISTRLCLSLFQSSFSQSLFHSCTHYLVSLSPFPTTPLSIFIPLIYTLIVYSCLYMCNTHL